MTQSRLRFRATTKVLSALALALTQSGVLAGTFSVSPVRIFMQPRERATAVTVTNEGDTPLVMQVELFTWKQTDSGADELTPTDDIVLAPPVIKLAPKAKQVVRLANLRPAPVGAQQTYRMIVRELPEAAAQQPGVQIQVALAFSLPVFITPVTAKRDLMCSAERNGASGLIARCGNKGDAYAQPVTISLVAPDGKTLVSRDFSTGYVLPQSQRNFELLQAGVSIPSGPAKLNVSQDDGSKQTFDVLLRD
jgi:fimbrial chaperone protein